MQKIIISLNDNNLRVSTIEKGNFKGTYAQVGVDTASNTTIINTTLFAETLNDLIKNLTSTSFRNLSLYILIQPEDLYLRFIQVNKNDGDIEQQIIKEVTTKSKDIPINDIYFSYNKIAPFVYQFTGVKKQTLESFIEVSNLLKISLENVAGWPILLPKYLDINDPAIFISKVNGNQVVTLSEFNSIFFLGVYEKEKSTSELQSLIKELSIYKRKTPINKVYLFNCDGFSLNPGYEVVEMTIPGSENEQARGFELHLMYEKILVDGSTSALGLINLLNLLPLPVVQTKNKSALVYIGTGVAVLVLLVGITGLGAFFIKKSKNPQVIQNTSQNQVLSNNTTGQSTPSQPASSQPAEQLKKEDLKIRIENGAGIQGIAGKTQDFLQNLGYKIDSIGNADETGRQNTLLKFKSTTAKYKDLLKADMDKSFTVVIAEDLDSAQPYDVLIVVGADAQF